MRTFRARDCRRYRNWRASARYIRGKHINNLVDAYRYAVFERVVLQLLDGATRRGTLDT